MLTQTKPTKPPGVSRANVFMLIEDEGKISFQVNMYLDPHTERNDEWWQQAFSYLFAPALFAEHRPPESVAP